MEILSKLDVGLLPRETNGTPSEFWTLLLSASCEIFIFLSFSVSCSYFFFYKLNISNLRQEKRATTCKKNDFFFSVSRAAVSISSACSVERNFSLKVSSSSVIPFLTNSRPKISLLRRKCQKYCYLVCLSGASLGPI